jgi:hypothetical protein
MAKQVGGRTKKDDDSNSSARWRLVIFSPKANFVMWVPRNGH